MSQITASTCADCFHPKENHVEKGVCSGSLECMCDHYNPSYLYDFAQRVEKEKYVRKSVRKRCEYILENIPPTRNASEKSFTKIYYEVWHGFKIRVNNPMILDKRTWDRLPNSDLINREKRRCKQWNEELKTYSKEVLWHQTAIYESLMEMSIEK